MTFPLHPAATVSAGSIMYAMEKAGKTTDQLHNFAKSNGYQIEKAGYNFLFSGRCVNEFLAC